MGPNDLTRYLRERGIEFRIFEFDKPTRTVREAAERLGTSEDNVVKSLLFITGSGPVLAIVAGTQRVDARKLAEAVGAGWARLATRSEVEAITGYPAGALPPVGHKTKLKTIIDPAVLKLDKVYAGGGAPNALLEISPQDILKLAGGRIVEVSE
ncbi:MAG: YbaK/EbsC family protein [Thermoproteota archaeon]|nr:MAG: YbaK/EbsC family protein [Candidatus Korarchaeota archaeon]